MNNTYERKIIKCVNPNDNCGKLICDILKESDVYLIPLGPPSCLRIIFYRAFKEELNEKLFCLPINNLDYMTGNNVEKIEETIIEVAKKNPRLIILYITCTDLLITTTYHKIASQMSMALGFPVRAIERGPLSKRKISPNERWNNIMEEIK